MNRIWFEVDGQTFSFGDSDVIDLNQSRVQIYMDCHRKYAWLFEEQLEPDRPRWALEDGKAIHEGLAVLGGGKSVDEAVKVTLTAQEASMPKRVLPGDREELQKHKEMAERLIRAYAEEYSTQTWVPFAQEVSGRVEIGEGTGVYLVFRTDKLAFWMQQLWIVDHKTTAKLDLRDVQKYAMDLQFTAYIYGTRKILQQRVAGVIVDMLVKTKVPQFHRDLFKRSDEELWEFEQEFVEIAREIAWRRRRVASGENWKIVFYKNTKECFRYGTCPYRGLCLGDNPIHRAEFISRKKDYVDDPKLLARTGDQTTGGPSPDPADSGTEH